MNKATSLEINLETLNYQPPGWLNVGMDNYYIISLPFPQQQHFITQHLINEGAFPIR